MTNINSEITKMRPATLEGCWELIDRLVKEISKLVKEIEVLKERINTNSKNSSQPPETKLK